VSAIVAKLNLIDRKLQRTRVVLATTYVLEQAAEHYLRFVAPTQSTVRPEIMAHVRRSVDKNRKLLQLLAE